MGFARGDLGGITEIRVEDDGHGFRPDDVIALFGSAKRKNKTSPDGRRVHGSSGKGRYTILGSGGVGTWNVVYDDKDSEKRFAQTIRCNADSPTDLTFSQPVESTAATGTKFVLAEPLSISGVEGDSATDAICQTFAVPLRTHAITLKYDGSTIDPASVIEREDVRQMSSIDGKPVSILIVEWDGKKKARSLHLCDSADISRSEINAGLPLADFPYTAYVNWSGLDEVTLPPDMQQWDPGVARLVDAAKNEIRAYLQDRRDEEQSKIIDEWVEQDAYPFDREGANNSVEEIARETFDIVAVTAAPFINENKNVKSRKFQLRMLKVALESNPGDLEEILQELLNLSDEQLADFKKLLSRTSLANIISTAKTIADRVDFVQALRFIVSNPEAKKTINERDHLHKILAKEPWIFGDEFSACITEKNLTELARNCLDSEGMGEVVIDEPVIDHTGNSKRRFDLLLPLAVPQGDESKRFLVVELKRPSHEISIVDYRQLEDYMFALARHTAFATSDTRWEFMIVGDKLSDEVLSSRDKNIRGFVRPYEDGRVNMWAKSWAEITQAADFRHRFIQEQLAVNADNDDGLKFLQTKHSELIPDAVSQMKTSAPKAANA